MSAAATRQDDRCVEFVRILPGPIERVWSYLADSDKRREWLGAGILPEHVGERFSLHIKQLSAQPRISGYGLTGISYPRSNAVVVVPHDR